MKRRVEIDKINKAASISKGVEGFYVKGDWPIIGRTVYSSVGKKVIEVHCPACEKAQEVYSWSFFGGGKFCCVCGVKMTHHGGFIAFKALTSGQFQRLLFMVSL